MERLPQIEALHARIDAICAAIGAGAPARGEPWRARVTALARALAPAPTTPGKREVALLHLALLGRYASEAELQRAAEDAATAGLAPLAETLAASPELATMMRARTIVELVPAAPGELTIDVTHTAGYDRMTGIQRVSRSLCRALRDAGLPFRLMVFAGVPLRPVIIDADAVGRVLDWDSRRSAAGAGQRLFRLVKKLARAVVVGPWAGLIGFLGALLDDSMGGQRVLLRITLWKQRLAERSRDLTRALRGGRAPRIRVPLLVGQPILLPELAGEEPRVAQYAALVPSLGNRLTLVVFDLIPLLHPEFCIVPIRAAVGVYLSLLRLTRGASGISHAVTEELRKLSTIVPRVIAEPLAIAAHPLPGEPIGADRADTPPATSTGTTPLILCVGTIEPRKNGAAVLRAALRVKRRGGRFRLVFAGGAGWMAEEFLSELDAARAQGLDCELRSGASDAELRALYRECRFTVFCSLAEGFGLPIVESLACGKPVLVSDVGSMREIAAEGGCLLCDPRDVGSIADGIARMLDDDALLERLVAEAKRRPARRWIDYAREIHAFAIGQKE